jgi:dynein heavy chain, axonemal
MFVDELEKRFPNYDLPKAFGQHVNAEISSQITVANELLDCFMMLTPVTQTQASKSEEHLTQDEHILKIIADLSEILPENFDVEDIKYRWRNDYDTALKVVLFQETSRYNVLLTKVRLSLETVGKCIAGQVVISPAIEKITNSLAENRVPAAFLTSYPSVKPLADWFRDLKDRIAFFRDWSYKGQPSVFNISAFTYPTGFTTALFQKYARKFEFPIDSLFMDFQFPPEKATHEKAKDGAYITGLYLEGAKWSVEENCLIEPQTMKLHELMPVMHFKPAQKRKKEAGKANPNLFYQCPCYYYPTRKGNL